MIDSRGMRGMCWQENLCTGSLSIAHTKTAHPLIISANCPLDDCPPTFLHENICRCDNCPPSFYTLGQLLTWGSFLTTYRQLPTFQHPNDNCSLIIAHPKIAHPIIAHMTTAHSTIAHPTIAHPTIAHPVCLQLRVQEPLWASVSSLLLTIAHPINKYRTQTFFVSYFRPNLQTWFLFLPSNPIFVLLQIFI